jgi:hypothetical protein
MHKLRFWFGVLVIIPGGIWMIIDFSNSRSAAAGSTPSGIPASWRDACNYVDTFGAGPLDDAHCARMIRERPSQFSEAEFLRRIKISGLQDSCIQSARTEQGRDACRMQYPTNW